MMGAYGEKHKIKCSSCGNETGKNGIALRRIKGIAKWICALCAKRLDAANGKA